MNPEAREERAQSQKNMIVHEHRRTCPPPQRMTPTGPMDNRRWLTVGGREGVRVTNIRATRLRRGIRRLKIAGPHL